MAVKRAAMEDFKRELHKYVKKMVQYCKNCTKTWSKKMKTMKKSNRPAKQIVEMATNLEVLRKYPPLMTSPSNQSTTSPPKRRGA